MSKSLIDAIRQTITEGARDKTSDGMTKDAKHFAQELHKVSDAGFKHMVQKDDETSDYAKMFNGDVDKAPTRPADYEPGQDLDKYVEYNEHLEIEEAKKKAKADKKCDDDCDCDDCSSDDVNEDARPLPMGGSAPGRRVGAQMVAGKSPSMQGRPSGSPTTPIHVKSPAPFSSVLPAKGTAGFKGRYGSGGNTVAPPKIKPPGSETAAAASSSTNPANRNIKYTGPSTPKPKAAPVSPAAREPSNKAAPVSPAAREPSNKAAPVSPAAREPAQPASKAPIPKAKQVPPPQKPSAKKPIAPAVKSPAVKPQAAKQAPAQRAQQRRQAEKNAVGPEYRKAMNSSFEIDINGTSYLVSEAHASAIAAFVEKYGEVNEVLTKSTTAGETVSDFVHSKNPKFKGKSKNKRIQMALASYYDRQRK